MCCQTMLATEFTMLRTFQNLSARWDLHWHYVRGTATPIRQSVVVDVVVVKALERKRVMQPQTVTIRTQISAHA